MTTTLGTFALLCRTKPAKFLVILIKQKEAPVLVPAE